MNTGDTTKPTTPKKELVNDAEKKERLRTLRVALDLMKSRDPDEFPTEHVENRLTNIIKYDDIGVDILKLNINGFVVQLQNDETDPNATAEDICHMFAFVQRSYRALQDQHLKIPENLDKTFNKIIQLFISANLHKKLYQNTVRYYESLGMEDEANKMRELGEKYRNTNPKDIPDADPPPSIELASSEFLQQIKEDPDSNLSQEERKELFENLIKKVETSIEKTLLTVAKQPKSKSERTQPSTSHKRPRMIV